MRWAVLAMFINFVQSLAVTNERFEKAPILNVIFHSYFFEHNSLPTLPTGTECEFGAPCVELSEKTTRLEEPAFENNDKILRRTPRKLSGTHIDDSLDGDNYNASSEYNKNVTGYRNPADIGDGQVDSDSKEDIQDDIKDAGDNELENDKSISEKDEKQDHNIKYYVDTIDIDSNRDTYNDYINDNTGDHDGYNPKINPDKHGDYNNENYETNSTIEDIISNDIKDTLNTSIHKQDNSSDNTGYNLLGYIGKRNTNDKKSDIKNKFVGDINVINKNISVDYNVERNGISNYNKILYNGYKSRGENNNDKFSADYDPERDGDINDDENAINDKDMGKENGDNDKFSVDNDPERDGDKSYDNDMGKENGDNDKFSADYDPERDGDINDDENAINDNDIGKDNGDNDKFSVDNDPERDSDKSYDNDMGKENGDNDKFSADYDPERDGDKNDDESTINDKDMGKENGTNDNDKFSADYDPERDGDRSYDENTNNDKDNNDKFSADYDPERDGDKSYDKESNTNDDDKFSADYDPKRDGDKHRRNRNIQHQTNSDQNVGFNVKNISESYNTTQEQSQDNSNVRVNSNNTSDDAVNKIQKSETHIFDYDDTDSDVENSKHDGDSSNNSYYRPLQRYLKPASKSPVSLNGTTKVKINSNEADDSDSSEDNESYSDEVDLTNSANDKKVNKYDTFVNSTNVNATKDITNSTDQDKLHNLSSNVTIDRRKTNYRNAQSLIDIPRLGNPMPKAPAQSMTIAVCGYIDCPHEYCCLKHKNNNRLYALGSMIYSRLWGRSEE